MTYSKMELSAPENAIKRTKPSSISTQRSIEFIASTMKRVRRVPEDASETLFSDIQEHLTCIAKAAEEADSICKDKCKQAHKVEKTATKETKMKKECLTLECSTLCYFDELAESCPEARNVLLKINIGQVHSMASAVHPITMEKMVPECRNLHDTEYMRAKLLASSSSLLMDHTPSEMDTEENPVITA